MEAVAVMQVSAAGGLDSGREGRGWVVEHWGKN